MCLSVPGRILSVAGDGPLARHGRVDFGGTVRDANLSLVPEAGVGDWILVHVGVGIARIDEGEAGRVFEFLKTAGEPEEEA